jgi:hypothetical protein
MGTDLCAFGACAQMAVFGLSLPLARPPKQCGGFQSLRELYFADYIRQGVKLCIYL